MSGNVSEWCKDWYDKDYYSQNRKNNQVNFTESKSKVHRGGSYITGDTGISIYSRRSNLPYEYLKDLGFQLCGDNKINKN